MPGSKLPRNSSRSGPGALARSITLCRDARWPRRSPPGGATMNGRRATPHRARCARVLRLLAMHPSTDRLKGFFDDGKQSVSPPLARLGRQDHVGQGNPWKRAPTPEIAVQQPQRGVDQGRPGSSRHRKPGTERRQGAAKDCPSDGAPYMTAGREITSTRWPRRQRSSTSSRS